MQQPRKPSFPLGEVIIGLLIVVILGILAEAFYPRQVNAALQTIAPSCSVRIESATITVRAWSANSDCNAILAGPNNFTGDNWAKLGATSASEVDGNIKCELNVNGRNVIVRDSGISTMGDTICGTLQGTYPGP